VNSKDEGLRSPLSYATENGHSEIVQQFLALADIDVNSRDDRRLRSPLWYATKNGHSEIAQLFMARVDVGVDAKDKYGRSPLWYAAKNEHLEIVQQTSKGPNRHVESSYNTCQV